MKISFYGATGGLGKNVSAKLQELGYDVFDYGSKHLNLFGASDSELSDNLLHNEVIIVFSNYNFDSYLHKYKSSSEMLKQIGTNVYGISRLISYHLPEMRLKKTGRIILASSVVVSSPVAGTAIYSAGKAYLEQLVKSIALENAKYGITANCLRLGYMDGGLTTTIPADVLNAKLEQIPAGRLGTIDEIVSAIKLLIENEYINGSVLSITGGL